MRLLITGSQGQVARAFIDVAPTRSDIEACAIGRPALDICHTPTIERAMADIKPDIVINTAAYTAVDDAEVDEDRAMALNRDGADMIAAAAARRGIPIIHMSTDYVYDGTKSSPYTETDAVGPTSVYGRSKLAGEQAVALRNPRHIILRTAWIYSPWGKNFVKTILNCARRGTPLRVVDDQIGSPTYAPHLVEAILGAAPLLLAREPDDPCWGIYHAAGSGRASWHDVAHHVLARSHHLGGPDTPLEPIPTKDYPTRAKRPANSQLDCAKFTKAFGGVRQPHWHEGVHACVKRLLTEAA